MTGAELKAFLESARRSQQSVADDLQITVRTVNRWVNSDLPVPTVGEYAIRYLLQQNFPPL